MRRRGAGRSGVPVEARVSVALARLPRFFRWQNRPLSREARQVIRGAGRQELMSLVVAALVRLERGR